MSAAALLPVLPCLWGTGTAARAVIPDAGVTLHCVGRCNNPAQRGLGRGGNALMGGHMYPSVALPSVDYDAYRWFLDRAAGGDILVLTADPAPCDIYNKFLYNMSGIAPAVRPNSVTTACFTSRAGANTPPARLVRLLAVADGGGASGIFITGGDQSLYYEYWRGTAVAAALSDPTGRVVVGGSSAGLAVQGEFMFTAQHGSVSSADALKYPTDSEVSLARNFIAVDRPWMQGVITDTHFIQRDRMGRLVAFVARVVAAGWARNRTVPGVLGVGVSEHTAVLVDQASGTAEFSGRGPVHFLSTAGRSPSKCTQGEPLSWASPGIQVWRWNGTAGVVWDFDSWSPASTGGMRYSLTVDTGVLRSTQRGGAIY